MTELRIEYMGLDDLVPDERNPKGHRLDLIDNSYSEFGYVESVVMDERTGKLLAGHGRLEQLQARRRDGKPAPDGIEVRPDGTWAVPVTRGTATKDDAHAAAFLVAANKLTEAGGWRDDALSELLHGLPDLPMLELTGFTLPELADLDESLAHPYGAQSDPDAVPDVPEVPVSKRGDVWVCGRHRVMCGDAASDIASLMGEQSASMFWTDPPYGVSYADKNGFLNSIGRPNSIEEPILGDHQTPEDVQILWRAVFTEARKYIVPGGCYYVTGPQGGDLLLLLLLSLRDCGYPLRHMLIWAKSNFVLGRSDYNYQHEPLIYGWVEGAGHQFFGESNESSVWEIPKPSASRLHPTMKPIELVARSIRNSCPARGTVLDPFGGSGSTLIAAQTEGRTACLMELDPRYVDVICRRYQEHTGDIPVLESTGEPHDFTRPEDSVSKG